MRRIVPCLVLATGVAALSACGAMLQIAGVQRPPELPDAQKPPRTISLRLHAAHSLNSGNGGPPLALVMRIYTLRQAEAFERMPYEGFTNAHTEREMLGADLLDVREVLLIPGQRHETREKVSREAGFVGVVALFRAPGAQRWRAAFPAADAERAGITLGLHGCAMSAGDGAAPRQQQLARPLSDAQCS